MALFEDQLGEVKEAFPDTRALLVLDEPKLRKYVLAWNPSLIQLQHSHTFAPGVAGLWDCVRVDVRALLDLTGDSQPDALAMLRRLQGLELVYPDGSIPVAVTKALNKLYRAATDGGA